MIRFESNCRRHLFHGKIAVRGNDLGEFAVAVRIEVYNHDECGAHPFRHGIEQDLEGLDAARRRANADDRQRRARGVRCVVLAD